MGALVKPTGYFMVFHTIMCLKFMRHFSVSSTVDFELHEKKKWRWKPEFSMVSKAPFSQKRTLNRHRY